MKCPYCTEEMEAPFVDIGIGEQQVGPYGCHACHAIEVHPYHDKPEDLSPEAKRTGVHPGPPELLAEVLAAQQVAQGHKPNGT